MINKVTLNGVEVPGIIRDTFHYRAQMGSSGALRIGGVYGSYIEFDYFLPSAVTIGKGDVLKYYQIVDVDKSFNPTTPSRALFINDFVVVEVSAGNKQIHIVAYDYTVNLNVDFSKRLKELESSFPMSIKDLVAEAETVAGVRSDYTDPYLPTAIASILDFEIQYFYADGITVRDIFNYVSEITGTIAICFGVGNVPNYIAMAGLTGGPINSNHWYEFLQYIVSPDSADYSRMSTGFNPHTILQYNVWYKENGLEKKSISSVYDGVKVVTSSGRLFAEYNSVSTPQNIYYITRNVLIDNVISTGSYTVSQFAYYLYGTVNVPDRNGYQYVPTKVKVFPFRFPYQIGGIAYVVDTNGNITYFTIMSIDLSDSEVILEGYGHVDTETGYGTNYGTADEEQTLLTSQINSLFSIVEELAQRRITELWSNSNTTSSFSAQTVLLSESMSDFDYLLISYAFSTSSQDFSTQLIPVSEIYDDAREFSLRINAATYNRTGARNLTAISDTEIKFLAASYNTSTANGYVIPANIYGIKL